MDIIWLKRDVRLTDHAPFHHMAKLSSRDSATRPLVILYNYEPDQLSEHSVHGSHVHFINEGLVDLDRRLSGAASSNDDVFDLSSLVDIQNYKLQRRYTIFTLQHVLKQRKVFRSVNGSGINQILTHKETGHLKSF